MRPHRRHLKSADDLVTLPQATRAGFVALAVERSRRATPYVDQGKAFRVQACAVPTAGALKQLVPIQAALLTAAGVSDKAAGYFEDSDKAEAIDTLIAEYLEPAGEGFADEAVYRFLLTRGDTLGGSMRNVGGALAQQKLCRYLMAALRNAGVPYRWLPAASNAWADMTADDAGIEQRMRGLSWGTADRPRTLLFNLNVPLVRNNIDLVLLNAGADGATLGQPERYVALGELKGGIDPAGADEHWKTAKSALDRVRTAFKAKGFEPPLCYVGEPSPARWPSKCGRSWTPGVSPTPRT